MARVAVSLFLLVCLLHTPFGFSKEKKWKKYKPYWCTDSGRTLIARGKTARECQRYCGDGCAAVEWWQRGKNACYLCRNLTLLTRFPHKSDKSFPPIVFIKTFSGRVLTPTTKPTTKRTTSTLDEGTPATSLHEKLTTIPSDEGTTIISWERERTTEENVAATASTTTVVLPSTAIEEETPSPLQEKKWKKYKPYWCTDSGRMLIKRGTSARQCQSYCDDDCVAVEWWKRGKNACYVCRNLTLLTRFPHKSDKSFPPIVFVKKSNATTSDNGATISSLNVATPTSLSGMEGTNALLRQDTATPSPEKEETTSSLYKEWTTSTPDEDVTVTSPEETRRTSSQDVNGTKTSKGDEEETSSPGKEITTSPSDEGTTPSLYVEETTSSPYQKGSTSSPDQQKTNSLQYEEGRTQSTDKEETTLPPDEEETNSSPFKEGTIPPSSPYEEATAWSSYVEATTSSPYEEGTNSLPGEEGTTSSPDGEQTTSSLNEEQTTSTPDEKATTSSQDEEGTTSSPYKEVKTTSLGDKGTSSSPQNLGITSPTDGEGTTSPPDEEETTPQNEREGATLLPSVDRTTSLLGEEQTTLQTDGEGMTAPTVVEQTTSFPEEEGRTLRPYEQITGTSPDEEGTTLSSDEEGTTSPPYEEGTTSSPNEGKPSSPDKDGTTSSSDEDGTTPSPNEGERTSSSDEDGTTPAPNDEGTTSSSDENGTTPSPNDEGTTSLPEDEGKTSLPDEEGTTSSPEKEGTTLSSDEEETTWSPNEEGTTASPNEEETAWSPNEEGRTSSPDGKGTTSSPEDEGTTSSPEKEGTTLSPDEERTTSSPEMVGTTSSPDDERTTWSPGDEKTTSSPDGKQTTPTSSTDEKETTSSPEDVGTTLSPEEKGTTSSPYDEQKSTTSSPTEETLPSSPRNVKAKALSETELEVAWEPPRETGGDILSYTVKVKVLDLTDGVFEPHLFQLSGGKLTLVVESLSPDTQYIISVAADNGYGRGPWSAVVSSRTSKTIKARIEPTEKTNTSPEGKLNSCVIYNDDGIYTLNASNGNWPHNGLCHATIGSNASKHDTYRLFADLYVPEDTGSHGDVYLGVFLNAADEENFDFVLFRFGESGDTCFQTGLMQKGQIDWFGSQTGFCPYGSPRKERWIHTTVEVRDSDVTVFLDGVHVTTIKGHLTPRASGGILVANQQGNVARFKGFTISDLQSLPFETRSCASLQENNEYYSLINRNGVLSRGFCRTLLKDSPTEGNSSYQISVDLFSEVDWSGDGVAYLGIIFNARDINNADFIYFRPFWKDHCYQTGYLLKGRQMREGSKTGHCSCAIKGGKWFNVRLEIRGFIVNVIRNNKPAATFKAHYHANDKGIGILVTGGCQNTIRFRNLVMAPLPELPFVSRNCHSARLSGNVYKLMAYNSEGDDTDQGICRALYPKVLEGNSYIISVNIYTQGNVLGGKYGVLFNAKNSETFEFVYFRPYNRDSCVQAGHLQGGKVKNYPKLKALACGYGFLRSGSWYKIRVKVARSEVKVLIDDTEVAVFKSQFQITGRGGVMLGSGVKRKISFKDYRIIN